MTTPDTLFELDMDTGERRVIKQQEVKAGYELLPERTPVGDRPRWRRSPGLWSTIANIFAKGATRCWSMAMAHGESIDADFSASRLSLLNRFVYAIAHVRGGGELGQQWYED